MAVELETQNHLIMQAPFPLKDHLMSELDVYMHEKNVCFHGTVYTSNPFPMLYSEYYTVYFLGRYPQYKAIMYSSSWWVPLKNGHLLVLKPSGFRYKPGNCHCYIFKFIDFFATIAVGGALRIFEKIEKVYLFCSAAISIDDSESVGRTCARRELVDTQKLHDLNSGQGKKGNNNNKAKVLFGIKVAIIVIFISSFDRSV